MKKEQITLIFSLTVLLLCIVQGSALAKQMIKEIRFESPTETVDKIIFELNGPYLPTGKALPGDNPRVYFDFPDTAPAGKVKNRIATNGNFIKQIRHAYHKSPKEKTRVVFDLVANQKMEFKQDFDQATNTLVITLYLAGTEPEIPAEPVAMKEAKPESVVSPAPEPEQAAMPEQKPEPVTVAEPMEPDVSPVDEEKPIDSMEETKIAVAPEPAEPVTPPAPEQAAMPEPEQVPEEEPRIANIPPSEKAPLEEATNIQPMSEIGVEDSTDAQESPLLYSIEYDPKSNRGEMISFKMNGFHPPVVFGIEEDLPRIVCFFKNATAGSELRDIIETNGQYVKKIQIGKYKNPDNIRVVLELLPGNNYDLQQIFFKDDKVFMLIINKAGKQISTQVN